MLSEAFARRQAQGLPGLTLMSCDNLAENGQQLDRLMREWLKAKDPQLFDWFALNCTCPQTMIDRIVPAIIKFVIATMGGEYVSPPVLDFMSIFKDSKPIVPVIFVLSPGADPATDIFKLANKLGMSGPKLK